MSRAGASTALSPARWHLPAGAAAAVLVYLDAFPNAFVWDDLYLVLKNPGIKRWAGAPALFASGLFHPAFGTSYYRPLQTLTYLLDYQLWGLAPAGFHLTSTLLHAGTALLLYRLAVRLSGDPRAALVAALLFVVHPVHTEAVAYVAGRSDPLAALLMLAALIAHLDDRPVFSLAAFFLALLAREASMVLIVLLVVVDFGAGRAPLARRYLAFVGILLAYLALRILVLGPHGTPAALAAVPLPLRLLTTVKVLPAYLALLVVPVGLHMERVVPAATSPLEPAVVGSLLLLGGLVATAVACRRVARPVATGIAWFLVALLPVANVVPLTTFMAEHWLYVPSMGLFLAAGWLASRVAVRTGWRPVATAVGLLAVAYAGVAVRRNLDWKDARTIFEATVAYAPRSARAQVNLGQAYQELGDLEKARTTYARALELDATPAERAHAHNNLGNLFRHQGRIDDAIRESEQALRLDPSNVAAYNNLALALQAVGRIDEAGRHLDRALLVDPDDAVTHNNKGNLSFRGFNLRLAMGEYLEAVRLDPDYADAHNNLGSAYFRAGWTDLAEREYRTALALNPGSDAVRRNLEIVLGRRPNARPELGP